jgi:ribosomal protein S12 methylthiotransferase accessory factor
MGIASETLKGHTLGTHRTVAPEETLRRIQPLLRKAGITRVANVTGLDVIGVPVVAVMRPNSRSIAVAQGKGLDLVAAKVSGIMESLENFHAERVRRPLVLASWEEMRARGRTLDLNGLPRLAGSVLDPRAPFLWTEGHETLGRTSIWIPFELVHTAYTLPLPTASGAFQLNDSGVASGNHPLEATSHAICELVERDAVTLWTYSPRQQQQIRKVNLRTIDDEGCLSVLDKFASAGIRVGVWDVTTDTTIPTFVCMIADDPSTQHARPLPSATGSGCHPSRGIALLRALTEAAQTRLTIIAGSRDDLSIATYRRGQDPTVASEAIDMITATGGGRRFSDGPGYAGASFHEDVAWELEQLRAIKIGQIAVVDLTLPEFQIPVVRVVIPGLEGVAGPSSFTPGKRLLGRLS